MKIKLKSHLYSVCLGIGLNMILPEFRNFGVVETEVNRKYN